jgi:hypothetical protein
MCVVVRVEAQRHWFFWCFLITSACYEIHGQVDGIHAFISRDSSTGYINWICSWLSSAPADKSRYMTSN